MSKGLPQQRHPGVHLCHAKPCDTLCLKCMKSMWHVYVTVCSPAFGLNSTGLCSTFTSFALRSASSSSYVISIEQSEQKGRSRKDLTRNFFSSSRINFTSSGDLNSPISACNILSILASFALLPERAESHYLHPPSSCLCGILQESRKHPRSEQTCRLSVVVVLFAF